MRLGGFWVALLDEQEMHSCPCLPPFHGRLPWSRFGEVPYGLDVIERAAMDADVSIASEPLGLVLTPPAGIVRSTKARPVRKIEIKTWAYPPPRTPSTNAAEATASVEVPHCLRESRQIVGINEMGKML